MSGVASCAWKSFGSPAQRLLGAGRAFFQLDNIHAEIRASLRQVQIVGVNPARAGNQFARRPQQLAELAVTQLVGWPFRFAAGIDAQQRTGREAVRLSHDRVQDALFDLRLLSAFVRLRRRR